CDVRLAIHDTKIGAGAAGPGNGQSASGKPFARQFFQAPLGGDGESDAAHAETSASSRSTQSAQPEAAMGAVAPRRSKRRSYWPPEASTAPLRPAISNTMPV